MRAMGGASTAAAQAQVPRDHAFHELRIGAVVPENAEASSFVLEVPSELGDRYAYRAGQFLTFRFRIGGATHIRSYSMSSSPVVDPDMQITVKRVPGGLVSNWMIDNLAPGDVVEATPPAGVFCLGEGTGDIAAFAAGSGITPVISIVKTALATSTRRVHLLYANRDPAAVIFAAELDELVRRHPGRFNLVHHFDVDDGFVEPGDVAPYARLGPDAEHFICGPQPFMDIVERALLDGGVGPDRIRTERFTPPRDETPSPTGPTGALITIELDGRVATAAHHPGTTILQMARQMGLAPPSSCESGNCATCMARIVEGAATMRANNALTPEEVAEGWVLTCQAEPAAPNVHVVYGYD